MPAPDGWPSSMTVTLPTAGTHSLPWSDDDGFYFSEANGWFVTIHPTGGWLEALPVGGSGPDIAYFEFDWVSPGVPGAFSAQGNLAPLVGEWSFSWEGGGWSGVYDGSSSGNFQATTAPEIAVLDPDSNPIADDEDTPIDFGSVAVGGSAVQKVFTVQNNGDATLTISSVTVPTGFEIDAGSQVPGAGTTIDPSSSKTLTVNLLTAEAGTKSGDIEIESDDPTYSTFNFAVSGTVTEAGLLDPADLRAGLLDGTNLKPSLVKPNYSGGAGTADNLKPGLLTPAGTLKPGMLTKDGQLKPSLRKPTH